MNDTAGPAGLTATATAVRLAGIRKRFGYRDVLRGIDLVVSSGSCLAIFGPNGAGKSTLLRIIATLAEPSHGDVEVLGHDARRETTAIRRRLGVVFHQSFLRPELTLDENLRFFSSLYAIDVRERASELLERFRLAHCRGQPVKTFSQGMVKRANLVRSLLHAPEMWILDEPFSGLDPQGRDLLVQVLREHVDGGGSALLVTHQTDLGRRLAQRAVTVDDGVVTRDEECS